MMHAITAFALMSLILTITPGPDSLLVLRGSVRGGRRAGLAVAAGAACGSLGWGICSAAGLTAMLAASAQLYRAVQLAGAAYLVFLGIRGWRAARGQAPGREHAGQELATGFCAGLLSNLLNPKVGLFFLAVMPQFVPQHAAAAGYALAFAVTDGVIAASWLAAVAWLSARARELLRRPRARAVMDRAAGITLAALGLKVAASQLT